MRRAAVRPYRPPLILVGALLVTGALASGFMIWVTLTANSYSDFAVHHDSARALWEGGDLYMTPGSRPGLQNRNPPHMLVLLSPLGLLPIREAMVVWLAITFVAMAACTRLWARVLPPGWAVFVFAILFASVAGYGNVRFANQAWVTAVAVTWAWIAWRDGRHRPAAMVLGVVASIKLFVLIVLPYLCWRRHWRAAAWFVAAGIGTTLVGVATCGLGAYQSWLATMHQQAWQGLPLNVSLLGTLTRALEVHPSGLTPLMVRPSWIVPLWAVGCAGIVGWLWWVLRDREDADRDFAALLVSMLLISPAGWAYYFPLAAGPLAATAVRTRSPLWIGGLICGLLPYAALSAGPPAAWSTVTLASAYMWSGVLLLGATCLNGPRHGDDQTALTNRVTKV